MDEKSNFNDASLSVQAYAGLQTAIDYANQVLGWYADEQAKVDILQPAIAAAFTALTDVIWEQEHRKV